MAYGREVKTSADYKEHSKTRHAMLTWRECEDKKRRARYEKSPEKWLKYYLSNTFGRPFEKPHLEIIDGAINASETGGRFCVSAERGIGKSTVLWGLVLYLVLSGKQHFPVCIPWADDAKKRAFRFWKSALCFNETLAADYPEFCIPFVHCRGIPQKLASTWWDDSQSENPNAGKPTGAQLAIGEGIIAMPDMRGCIGGETINGNPRGLNHPQKDGAVLRPSLVMLDDVQDRQTAKSAHLCQNVIDIIDGDVAGIGETGSDMPMLMSGNCILPDDVMSHYLGSTEWHSLKVPCIEQWPDKWDDEKSDCRALWAEWYEKFLAKDKPYDFYKKYKKGMTEGMKLSAPLTFKKKAKDPLYAVIRMYHKMGHDAFMAERQQSPERRSYSVYSLTTDLIKSRVDKSRSIMQVPDWAHINVVGTDINPSYALSSVSAGFGKDQMAGVEWYGLYKRAPLPVSKDMTEATTRKKIYEALSNHGKELAALPCRPNLWLIDGGGTPQDCVIQFCANSLKICGIEAVCCFGRGWKTYRPTSRHKNIFGEQMHKVIENRDRQWLLFNADYWREIAQKGWTGEPGAPGSCSLFNGRHDDFALQICREQLTEKIDAKDGRTVWLWDTAPGPHDYGDCMTMCYVGAAMRGVGTAGGEVVRSVRRHRRQVRHIKV